METENKFTLGGGRGEEGGRECFSLEEFLKDLAKGEGDPLGIKFGIKFEDWMSVWIAKNTIRL